MAAPPGKTGRAIIPALSVSLRVWNFAHDVLAGRQHQPNLLCNEHAEALDPKQTPSREQRVHVESA